MSESGYTGETKEIRESGEMRVLGDTREAGHKRETGGSSREILGKWNIS